MKNFFGTLFSSITVVALGATLVGILHLIVTLPTMWLWNFVVPDVFGLPEIRFWQTLALLVLSSIFFKTSISSNSPSK